MTFFFFTERDNKEHTPDTIALTYIEEDKVESIKVYKRSHGEQKVRQL